MPGQIYPNYESPTANIQGTPVAPTAPTDGQLLVYSAAGNTYYPSDPIVSGPDKVGTPPTVNPVQIGGVGPDGNVHEVQTDLSGDVKIDESRLLDVFTQILYELRAIKTAILALDSTLDTQDFEAAAFTDEAQGATILS